MDPSKKLRRTVAAGILHDIVAAEPEQDPIFWV